MYENIDRPSGFEEEVDLYCYSTNAEGVETKTFGNTFKFKIDGKCRTSLSTTAGSRGNIVVEVNDPSIKKTLYGVETSDNVKCPLKRCTLINSADST